MTTPNAESAPRVHRKLVASRQAAADQIAMLTSALVEFHAFVAENLDPDPSSVEDYLAWPGERIAALRELLGDRAQIDGSDD